MKTNYKAIIFVLFATGLANYANAQIIEKKTITTVTEYFGEGKDYSVGYRDDSTKFYLESFKESMPKGFQEAAAPRFVIIGKNHNFMMGIGGRVKGIMGYGFNDNINNDGFIINEIPMFNDPSSSQALLYNAKTSRLVFRFLTMNEKFKGFEALIETDFCGTGSTLRLRKAYVKFKGITIGQDNSIFSDLMSSPFTVDSQGPNGLSYVRTVMVGYSQTIKENIVLSIAIEQPSVSATYDTPLNKSSMTKAASQRIPDIPISIGYHFKGTQDYIKASAVFRGMSYYNNVQSSVETEFGWGIQLTGKFNIAKSLSAYFGGIYGEGLGKYIQDFQGTGTDLVWVENGEMTTVPMLGWHAALSYELPHNLSISCVYSQAHLFDTKNLSVDSGYKLGRYFAINLAWQLGKAFEVAIEYDYGTRINQNGNMNHSNRVLGMVTYNF